MISSRTRAVRLLVVVLGAFALFAAIGCYNNNTGETNIGDQIKFTLPAFPETGSHKVLLFTEMHYQPSYRTQESPRLLGPDGAVPITGAEVVLATTDDYVNLPNPGGDVTRGQQLYATNCLVCHGSTLEGNGAIMNFGPRMAPANMMGEVTKERTDGELYGLISFGGNTGFITRLRALNDPEADPDRCVGQGSCPMPEFRKMLTESERWDIVAYVRGMQATR